ncbi:MAG: ROK family protein [Calditrichaeota bacterium]|nr:MAG: ROK family protein [Calditrichota bacterium]
MNSYKLGIDLGGSKIEGAILSERNEVLFRERVATEQEKGYAHILNRIKALYDKMVGEIGGASHTFGIGTPGAVSPKTGLLRNSNTLCLNDRPLAQELEKLLGRPVVMQNDANCFALAEAVLGAGVGHHLVFGIIMGTGCGGGIVCGGEVRTGPHAIAGEWGHTSIDPDGEQCWCGSRGCLETIISGGGLEQLYRKQFGRPRKLADIVADYRAGRERETGFMQTFFANFGRGVANLINVLDPDIIVLGGGLSNIDELYTEGVSEVAKRVFSDYLTTPIVKNRLGDSAGVLGAAMVGR